MVKLIAVTGGIGSGKTVVMGYLKECGYTVVSCDDINKELYNKFWVKRGLKKLFPAAAKGLINITIDKSVIANEVFSDREKLKKLNSFMHPKILKEASRRAHGLTFMEVPLLYECNLQKQFDGVIVILRSVKDRIESVKSRSNLTEEQVIMRMRNQINYDTFDFGDAVIINNDGDEKELKGKLLVSVREMLNSRKIITDAE